MGERFFMMMNLKGEDSLVMQLVAGQCFQHRQHGSGLGLGGGQIHIAVVAALHFAGPGTAPSKPAMKRKDSTVSSSASAGVRPRVSR